LVQECIAGTNIDDFRNEFLSYWGWTVTDSSTPTYSLLDPVPPTRAIRLWMGNSYYLLGETDIDIANWLRNRRNDRSEAKDTTTTAIMLWLEEPLLPSEYPKCGADLLRLAGRTGGTEVIRHIAVDEPGKIVVAIASATVNGPCMAVVTLPTPQVYSTAKNGTVRTLNAGFRKGKIPTDVLVSRYFAGTRVIPSNVERIDAQWVHGRDQNPFAERLLNTHVVVLGCGSLGAPVALALMQSGLGRATLVDPDILNWSNISRHPLGAAYVGRNKADALADRIRRDFPHVKSVASFPRRWQDVRRLAPQLLESADLIVSAMGDWEGEGALNDWHLEHGRTRPIVYGWTEPHACAGHGVAICRIGGCFSCGLDAFGAPRSPITTWSQATYLQEPACGAVYQPYGAIEVSHTVSMIADVALKALIGGIEESTERIWTGDDRLLESVGGAWDASWQGIAKAKGPGAFMSDRAWPTRSDCIACGK
jgi:molybdopterin/thiamine biosynthesis adenylyltransferase